MTKGKKWVQRMRKRIQMGLLLSCLLLLTAACANQQPSDQSSLVHESTVPAPTANSLRVVESPSGKFRVIALTHRPSEIMQARFEGTLTLDDKSCVALETTEGTATLAFAELGDFPESSSEFVAVGETFQIGEVVSFTGGTLSSLGEELTLCGDPDSVILVLSVD